MALITFAFFNERCNNQIRPMKIKRQDPESREFMLQLTRELVDRDIDRLVEERLKERYEKQNVQKNRNTLKTKNS